MANLDYISMNKLHKFNLPDANEYIYAINNIQMATTGFINAMESNKFFAEACQMIINAIRLYQDGYFDCAFYSLRQSIELSIGTIFLNANPDKYKNWNKLEKGFESGYMARYLADNEPTFKEVREKLCDYFAANYEILDRDLLITAAMFHDIGKLYELSSFPSNEYTDDGQLLGHIFLGAEWIGKWIQEIPGFPVVLASELRHCILAHHGELEYGSPKKPSIAEAMVLNFADNADAKLQTTTELYEKSDPTLAWLGFNRLLDSNIRQSSGYLEKRKIEK